MGTELGKIKSILWNLSSDAEKMQIKLRGIETDEPKLSSKIAHCVAIAEELETELEEAIEYMED